MPWIEPITDRTSSDVSARKGKAYLNIIDLNRIEGNIQHLSDTLNGYGYGQDLITKTDWAMVDFPYSSQLERVRANVQTLLDAYYPQQTPLPDTLERLDYRKMNAIEKNLKQIYEMLNLMAQSFKYCGTFYAGEGEVI